MRPRQLELSGFTAFRDPVTVDFRGADLFALTGPTGSGKSSIIDAIVFSLYGSVPRIGQRDVAPIVSLGKLEARVRFEFSLDGTDYTVVRVVRRTKTGASTAEARLERDGEVLAGTADEVTETIGRLLGLDFDHFTKSVVLPQGQFAAFLHDRPADRQKLLRELLDLGVYERMRDLAKQRKTAADTKVQILQTQLDELAYATSETTNLAEKRLLRLQALGKRIEEAEPKLQALRDRIGLVSETTTRARASIGQLNSVRVPEGMQALATRLTEARWTTEKANDEATAAREKLKKVEATRQTLPAAAEIERIVGLHRALATDQITSGGLTKALDKTSKDARAAADGLKAAEAAVLAARRDLESASRSHAAHALAATLVAGEPCPVCRTTVEQLPHSESPPALAAAEAARDAALAVENAARQRDGVTGKRLATEEARLADTTTRIEGFEKDLADAPDLDEALETMGEITAVEANLKEARAEADRAARAVDSARKKADAIETETTAARRRFDQTRDQVASLEPPAPERTDLAADWNQLRVWAVGMIARLTDESAASEQLIEDLQRQQSDQEGVLNDLVEQEGLDIGGRPIRDVVVAAVAAATHELAGLRQAGLRADEIRATIATSTETAELAKSLGRHLSATGFEAWLMEEALSALVAGANLLLDELADGAYSLEVVKRDFRVVDHRNADEARPVKTLSGGETFLVSLALALSLAEQLASMSVHGGGRLESVFLDEGFGTLDAETLDTVAHVIQELGARGRTVGIVTHVRELAEQVPVRFEVRKGPGTATVERVEL
ncbi:MAG: SMC family ATPase [Acidimicrobiia bacterium]|nr:SMC family ATPase [Acidimicrobiia bacterium]MDH3397323.1 SMC family ATPase [Acidimicrobiia bacterium]